MRRIAIAAAIAAASTALAQHPHGLTAPRDELERAFVAIWLTETARIDQTGSLYPTRSPVWDPMTGSSWGYGPLQVGMARFVWLQKAMPPVGESGWMDHWQLEEPFYSWLFFVRYVDRTVVTAIVGGVTEPPSAEAMIRAWADPYGWSMQSQASTEYWLEARRYLL